MTIQIVDRGKGPQLSTSRITVQDLVPYIQRGSSPAEIMRWIPAISIEEIAAIENYVKEHYDEVMDLDRCIRERNAQRKNPPEVARILEGAREERLAIMERLRKEKANGAAS